MIKTITTKLGYTFNVNDLLSCKEVALNDFVDLPKMGTDGYFADSLKELIKVIDKGWDAQLFGIKDDTKPFSNSCCNFKFFLPKNAVIAPKEKKAI